MTTDYSSRNSLREQLVVYFAIAFALFQIINNFFYLIPELWFIAIHFGGFAALCALDFHKPSINTSEPKNVFIVAGNRLLVLLAIGITVYLILFEDALYAREGNFILSDYLASAIAILLVMEFARRTSGWFMPCLIFVSLAYVWFWGPYIVGRFSFPGLNLENVLYRSYFQSDGMFGQVANISATYVFMFVVFGAFLLRSGAGEFIINIAQALTGRYTGGTGMVAVVSSGLMGSVSGSAVANAASTGVLTIPMMNRSGFPPQFSAGVVAAASTGGQLMPPVMGAGAFVMANYTQISYLTIIAVSTLPALLYFLTVAFFVRIEAKRLGLQPNTENIKSAWQVLKQGWPFVIPLAVLVGLLIAGYTPIKAAIYAILSTIATSWLTDNPMTLPRCRDALVDAVRTMIPTALLLVAVGIVIMVVNTTGIGAEFSQMIVEWSGGNLVIALVLVALASLILGMGLPVAASYIVLATLSAPMLFDLISQAQLLTVLQSGDMPANVQAIVNLFGGDINVALQQMPLEQKNIIRAQMLDPGLLTGMLLSAHLIIFWLSQDSNVTPPVCLAAFAAASVAKTPPMATGFTSWKIAKGLYLVPILFAYTPLITGNWPERIETFLWACAGLYALAGILQWHLEKSLTAITAPLVLISAGLILWPGLNILYRFVGLLLLIGILIWQKRDVVIGNKSVHGTQ